MYLASRVLIDSGYSILSHFLYIRNFVKVPDPPSMDSLELRTKILFLLSVLFLNAAAQSCSPLDDVKITFFGYPDNSPPGAGIAYNQCGHSLAGGTGTYDDPITFATATDGDFNVCDVVYLPWVKKYARYEDDCEQCSVCFNMVCPSGRSSL